MTPARFDAVVVGAGHNGLTCAAYLAGAGLSVCVARAARRRRRSGGHRRVPSRLSQLDGELHGEPARTRRSSRDLRLHAHGLAIVKRSLANFLPLPGSAFLKVGGGLAATQAEVANSRRATRSACPTTTRCSIAVADVLRELLHVTPPNVGGDAAVGSRWRSTHGRRQSRFVRSIARASATCSTFSPRARAKSSIAGSSANRSRRPSASTRSSAISRAPTRRARLMCCCITCSAK